MELTNISLMLFGEEEAPAAVESAPDPGAEFDRGFTDSGFQTLHFWGMIGNRGPGH